MATLKNHIFYKADAESITLSGQYTDDSYKDLHLVLSKVELGNGAFYDELFLKLVNNSGAIGIEFRDSEDGVLFRHFEDSVDEYGPYLRYLGNISLEDQSEQQILHNRMNASERIMVFSCIMLLPELLMHPHIEDDVKLTRDDLYNWRLSACQLKSYVEMTPVWLSFDSVYLKEEYKTEFYEHIWLVFKNLLVGDLWRDEFELKIAATDLTSKHADRFCDNLYLEFREYQDRGISPLFGWPPNTSDDYGPNLNISVSKLSEIDLNIRQDKELIHYLGSNLPSIIDKLDESRVSMRRKKSDWKHAYECLINNPTRTNSPTGLEIEEVYGEDDNQYIVFSVGQDNLVLKLKATKIQPENFYADISIELNNGTRDIIYSNTEFFIEDELKPKVSIPFDLYLKDIRVQREHEFHWLNETLKNVYQSLNEESNLDELIRRLWVNMIQVAMAKYS